MSNKFDKKARADIMRIGATISSLRKLKQISQQSLAEKVGISVVEMSLIESANTYKVFSMEVLFNIASALGVDAGKLLRSDISV